MKNVFLIMSLVAVSSQMAISQQTLTVTYGNSNLVAVPGEEFLLPVSVYCSSRSLLNFIHIPVASDNTYIDSRTGGILLYPLRTYCDASFLAVDLNEPYGGWTSQSLLAWARLGDCLPQEWINAQNGPTIFYFKMMVHYNPSWVGQQDSIFQSGYNWRNYYIMIGDSSSIEYNVEEHYFPVTFRTYATGSGYGVMGNMQNHVDMHYNGNPVGYRLQDVTRRSDTNPHGHSGQMRSDQSIATYKYDGTNPGDTIINYISNWQDTFTVHKTGIDAQVYSGLFYDFLLSQYNRNSYDTIGSSMICTVEDTTIINNAQWLNSQKRLVFGTSGLHRRSWAGCPEAVAHEYTHGITRTRAGLLPEREAGALDESFSNMMGVTFRYVLLNRPASIDWSIGGNSYQNSSNYDSEMSMVDPHGDTANVALERPIYYQEPGYWHPLSDTSDYCGIHTNSGVPDKMFYFLSVGGTSSHNGVQVTSIGIENAARVMYEADAHGWQVADSTFMFARYWCVDRALNGLLNRTWANQVANAWNAVGVCDSCAYMPGDANHNGVVNGIDVNYLTDYFKGRVPAAYTCDLAYRQSFPWTDFYAPADCNGSCGVNGVDITYLVAFLKGQQTQLLWCPHYTPETP